MASSYSVDIGQGVRIEARVEVVDSTGANDKIVDVQVDCCRFLHPLHWHDLSRSLRHQWSFSWAMKWRVKNNDTVGLSPFQLIKYQAIRKAKPISGVCWGRIISLVYRDSSGRDITREVDRKMNRLRATASLDGSDELEEVEGVYAQFTYNFWYGLKMPVTVKVPTGNIPWDILRDALKGNLKDSRDYHFVERRFFEKAESIVFDAFTRKYPAVEDLVLQILREQLSHLRYRFNSRDFVSDFKFVKADGSPANDLIRSLEVELLKNPDILGETGPKTVSTSRMTIDRVVERYLAETPEYFLNYDNRSGFSRRKPKDGSIELKSPKHTIVLDLKEFCKDIDKNFKYVCVLFDEVADSADSAVEPDYEALVDYYNELRGDDFLSSIERGAENHVTVLAFLEQAYEPGDKLYRFMEHEKSGSHVLVLCNPSRLNELKKIVLRVNRRHVEKHLDDEGPLTGDGP